MIELLIGYVVIGALFIGAPAVFFGICFLPALMRTTGETIGNQTETT